MFMRNAVLSIIGGGASGMSAAIEAAKRAKYGGCPEIVIFERLQRVGKKILSTGNGRCNLLNENLDFNKYHGDKLLLKNVFNEYPLESDIEFFKDAGLYTRTLDGGRIYPLSLQAQSVLDSLRFELEKYKIKVVLNEKITKIKKSRDKFILNDEYYSDAVIAAGGGASSPFLGSDGSCFDLLSQMGIKISAAYPSLTGIIFKNKDKSLKGARSEGKISVLENDKIVVSSKGELQYTDYGVSGIPAMECSGTAAKLLNESNNKICVKIDSLPEFSANEIISYIENRKSSNPDLLCENLLSGIVPKKLGLSKLKASSINLNAPLSSVTKNQILTLSRKIKDETFLISGVLGFNNSQVTKGGASTDEFNNKTLESLKVKGLFASGEVLDVDALCGGFNLMWAWSSGRCAGKHALEYLENL